MTLTMPALPTMRNLREVIHSQAIQPTFQPVVHLEDGIIKAYEALARFDKSHFTSPAEAFAAAMAGGVGVDLELVALERAFEYLDAMPAGAWMSANLSVEALLTPAVTATLLEHARRNIAIELTEHTQVHDYPSLIKVTEELRAAGILIAV